jgi:hypothetical protein
LLVYFTKTSHDRSSQKRLEKKLEIFMAEVRAGLREGSMISTHTAHMVEQMDDDVLWLGLRRELEDIGISPQLLSEKKDFVVSWIKTAIAEGTLEELLNNDDDLQIPKLTSSSQQNHPLGRVSSSGTVSSRLSPTTPSKPHLLSTRWFLSKLLLLQDDKKFLAAAKAGNIAIVTEQLKYCTDIEVKTRNGWTALVLAAQDGHEEVVKVLLDGGAEKETKDRFNWAALLLAAQNGHGKAIQLLLDWGQRRTKGGRP